MSGSSSPAAGSSSLATSSKALFGPIPLPSDTYARCLEVFGVVPKPEQIEVADILARREDCILRAGYAWGEIDVYFIPLILWPDRITIILSPLKTLAEEQQQKLDRLGISSIAIRWETDITKKLLNELGNGKYRAVFLCPKILITGDRLRQLWFMEPWRSSLLAVVVDEAHCISTWGKDFRKDYEYIGTLRARVRRDVPFLAVSATLPPRILDDVKAGLYCEPDVRVISVGNDRPNIKYAVTRPQRPVNSYRDLSFLLDFKKSIVYFPNNSVTESAARYLRGLLDNSADLSKIAVYHSVKSDELKRVVLEKFRDNKVLLLLTTEALEMGCDINDVVRVVQYGVPSSISTLIQRFGRAARNPTIEGHGLLLAPQTVSSKIDNDLSRYIQAEGCRRRVLNEIFGNEHRDNDRCCDKCNPEKQANAEAYNGTSAKATSKQAPHLTDEELNIAISAIEAWRKTVWERDYYPECRFYTVATVIQKEILKTLAARCAEVVAADSIESFLNWLPGKDEYFEDLTRILMEVNETITARRNEKSKSVVQKDARVERAESSGSGVSSVQYTPAPELARFPSPQPFSDLARNSTCTTPRLSTRLHSTHSPFGLSSIQYSQAHELTQPPSPFPDLTSTISPPSTPRSKMSVPTTPSRKPSASRKISFNPWSDRTVSTYNQGAPAKKRRVDPDEEDDDCLSFITHGSLDRNPFLVPEAPNASDVATTVTNNQDGNSNTSNENKEENDNSTM